MKSYFLIFDDTCPVCLEAVRRVQRLDDLGLVSLVPLSTVAAPKSRSALSPDKLARQMHLVCSDGQVWAGADAVARLASICPRSRLAGEFLMLPRVRQIARAVYGLIARHRLKLARLASRQDG